MLGVRGRDRLLSRRRPHADLRESGAVHVEGEAAATARPGRHEVVRLPGDDREEDLRLEPGACVVVARELGERPRRAQAERVVS